jgi:hypothetical protein
MGWDYGTHLSAYVNLGVGNIETGTLIGYVGRIETPPAPHLHCEIHAAAAAPPPSTPPHTADLLCGANKR